MQLPKIFDASWHLEIEEMPPDVMFDATVTTFPNPLDCAVEEQKKDEWCWAAVCAGIQDCYETPIRQCEIAEMILGPACCDDPSLCDEPMFLMIALNDLRFLASSANQVKFDKIETEINEGRPVCCFIDYGTEVGHFIIISGFESNGSSQSIGVLDPTPGGPHSEPQFIPFASFKVAYGSGTWKETYFTKRRN